MRLHESSIIEISEIWPHFCDFSASRVVDGFS